MNKILLLLIFTTFLFAQDLLLDDLLSEYENSEELYLKTQEESTGHLIVYSRSDLDKMQAYTLNDILKTIRTFTLQMKPVGRTTLVQSGNSKSSVTPIKLFINSHELNAVTQGDAISQYGNMSLYFVDHIEIYQSGNSITLGSNPAAMIIRLYTKDPSKENGTFAQISTDSQASLTAQVIKAGIFKDYTYLANIDINKNNHETYDSTIKVNKKPVNYKMSNDVKRGQLFVQLAKKDDFEIEVSALTEKNELLTGFKQTGLNGDLSSQDFYIQANKYFKNNLTVKMSASYEELSITNDEGIISTKDDTRTQSNVYSAVLEKKFINGSNNLLVGAHLRRQEFKRSGNKNDLTSTPTLSYKEISDLYMFYLENTYNFNESNLFSFSGKIDHYEEKYTPETQHILQLAYVSLLNSNWKFKVFATDGYIHPLFLENTPSDNVVVNPNLKSSTNRRISTELTYTTEGTTVTFIAGTGESKDTIVKQGNKYINSPKTGKAQKYILRLDHAFNFNNKIALEYFTSKQPVYTSGKDGGLIQAFNKVGKFNIYNELIYRSKYTNIDGIDVKAGYNYSLGVTYPYSKQLEIKLKGENLFNDADTVIINGVNIPITARKAILSLEYAF